jgi:cyanate permease
MSWATAIIVWMCLPVLLLALVMLLKPKRERLPKPQPDERNSIGFFNQMQGRR